MTGYAHPFARDTAAIHLAEGGASNTGILRLLMKDTDSSTAAHAAGGLFVLGDENGRTHLAEWAGHCDLWSVNTALAYVRDLRTLTFLKEPLAACIAKMPSRPIGYSIVEQIIARR